MHGVARAAHPPATPADRHPARTPGRAVGLPCRANAYNVKLTANKRWATPRMSDFFQDAYRRARSRYTREQWLSLPPQQITDAIYREMRQMDAETSTPSVAGTSRTPSVAGTTRPRGGAPDNEGSKA